MLSVLNADIRRAGACNLSGFVADRILEETSRQDLVVRDNCWREWERSVLVALILIASRDCPSDIAPLRFMFTLLTHGEQFIEQQLASQDEHSAFAALNACPTVNARKLVLSALAVRLSTLMCS